MNKLALTLLLLASAPLAALASPATNLVSNGSFETNLMSPGTWGVGSNLTGWTGGSYGIELRDNVDGTASDGRNFVELDTTANSSMSQTISTVLGQWYLLTFDYADRVGTAASTDGIAWSFGGAGGVIEGSGSDAWQHFSTRVQADSSRMTLNFSATGLSDSMGTSLDNVSVSASAVPEPAGITLVLGALGAAAAVTRRRQRRTEAQAR